MCHQRPSPEPQRCELACWQLCAVPTKLPLCQAFRVSVAGLRLREAARGPVCSLRRASGLRSADVATVGRLMPGTRTGPGLTAVAVHPGARKADSRGSDPRAESRAVAQPIFRGGWLTSDAVHYQWRAACVGTRLPEAPRCVRLLLRFKPARRACIRCGQPADADSQRKD